MRNVHQAFGYGLLRRPHDFRDDAADARTMARRTCMASAGHKRMQPLASCRGAGQLTSRSRAMRRRSIAAHVRQGDRRALLRNVARRGSALAPAGAHRGVQHDLRPGIRPSMRSILPGERLRDRRTTPRQPPRLQINASNCVHCKTCDIMDPLPGDHLGSAREWRTDLNPMECNRIPTFQRPIPSKESTRCLEVRNSEFGGRHVVAP